MLLVCSMLLTNKLDFHLIKIAFKWKDSILKVALNLLQSLIFIETIVYSIASK